MAKKEKTDEELILDLITKIKNVFRKDIYILNNYYIIGGEFSDETLHATYFCELVPEYSLTCKKFFGDHELIYIKDITEFKEDTSKWNIVTDEDLINEIRTKIESARNVVNDPSDWKSFSNLKLSVIDDIMNNGKTSIIHQDEDDPMSPYCIVAKKIFPLLGPKTMDHLLYEIRNYENAENIYLLITRLSFTHFILYGIIYFARLTTDIKYIDTD